MLELPVLTRHRAGLGVRVGGVSGEGHGQVVPGVACRATCVAQECVAPRKLEGRVGLDRRVVDLDAESLRVGDGRARAGRTAADGAKDEEEQEREEARQALAGGAVLVAGCLALLVPATGLACTSTK